TLRALILLFTYTTLFRSGDILYIRYHTEISLITPLITNIVPSLDVRFAGQRTIVEDIVLHGLANNCSNNPSDAEATWCDTDFDRSEEHTSELQSRENLVC